MKTIRKIYETIIMSNLTYVVFAVLFIYFAFHFFSNERGWSINTIYCTKIDNNLWGTFGDFVGGVLGTMFTIVSVLLVVKTFKKQMDVTQKNRDQVEIQRFNDIFFELLKIYQEQEKELQLDEYECGNHIPWKYKDFFSRTIYLIDQDFKTTAVLYKNRKNAVAAYLTQCLPYDSKLSICYKLIYRMLDTVDSSPIDGDVKSSYIKMLRAQLTEDELICLRYHILCGGHKKFARLVNKYNLLKHTPILKLLEFKYWAQNESLTNLEKREISVFIAQLVKFIKQSHKTITFNRCYETLVFSVVIKDSEIVLTCTLKRPLNINDRLSGLGKFNDEELSNFLMDLIKEIVVFSNFSTLNNYRDLYFSKNTEVNDKDNCTTITISVVNTKSDTINLVYDEKLDDVIQKRSIH